MGVWFSKNVNEPFNAIVKMNVYLMVTYLWIVKWPYLKEKRPKKWSLGCKHTYIRVSASAHMNILLIWLREFILFYTFWHFPSFSTNFVFTYNVYLIGSCSSRRVETLTTKTDSAKSVKATTRTYKYARARWNYSPHLPPHTLSIIQAVNSDLRDFVSNPRV